MESNNTTQKGDDMKRSIAMLVILVVFASILAGCNFQRMGKDIYYVQITMDGQKEETTDDKDNPFTTYKYSLPAFDEEGTEKKMEFTAQKNLRKEAYLRVYYSSKKGVTSWEEVQKDDLPAKVKEKLESE